MLERDHPLPVPSLPRVKICSLTGLLPSPQSLGTITELFLPGTEPVESADTWFGEDGRPLLPQEYAGWCASGDNRPRATVAPDAARLAIISPRDRAIFILEEDRPASHQAIEFRINLLGKTSWKLNGKPLRAPINGRFLWPIEKGEWTLEISNEAVTRTARFTVQEE